MKRIVMDFLKKLVMVVVFSFSSSAIFAQEAIGLEYDSEKSIGVNLNTNAGLIGGVAGEYSTRLNERAFRTFGLEIVNVKHPQETKVSSTTTGNTFVYGKENYFFVIRPSFGREWVIFPPAKDDGVQINGSISGGVSLGVLKPYIIQYDYSVDGDMSMVRSEGFDPEIHSNNNRILGNGNFFKGFDDISVVPGVHLKGSVTFYFGNFEKRVSALEAGGLVEAFVKPGEGILEPNRVNIMPFAENDWLFTALYINIFYGWRK